METAVHQISELEKHLLELVESSTKPDKALQMLSSPCFSLTVNSSEDFKPLLIFFAYMKFIVGRFTYACVDGICEDILRKTVVYSRNCSRSGNDLTHLRRIYPKFVPREYSANTFLQSVLSNHNKCSNPYTRLELFRLYRIFSRVDSIPFGITDESAWEHNFTFIRTINDIQPHCYYPNGYANELLYNIHDLWVNLMRFGEPGRFLLVMSENVKFFSNCIQLIGVFARIASANPDHKRQMDEIHSCWLAFDLCCSGQFPDISDLKYRPYVVETICELTAATINNKRRSEYKTGSIGPLRDKFVTLLGICSKPCELPRLLLTRQIQGPMAVRQHCLLLENLKPLYKNIPFNDSDFEESDSEESDSDGNSEAWAVLRQHNARRQRARTHTTS